MSDPPVPADQMVLDKLCEVGRLSRQAGYVDGFRGKHGDIHFFCSSDAVGEYRMMTWMALGQIEHHSIRPNPRVSLNISGLTEETAAEVLAVLERHRR